MSESRVEEYVQLLKDVLRKLEDVCRSRGYDVTFSTGKTEAGFWLATIKISNPANGGMFSILLEEDSPENLFIIRNKAKPDEAASLRQLIADLEVLSEELSREGLRMSDEIPAKRLLYGLLATIYAPNSWREVAAMGRIALEYGIKLDYRGFLEADAPEWSVEKLAESVARKYGIDENAIRDVQVLLKYNKGKYPNVMRKYFLEKATALALIGERPLTVDEEELVRKMLLEGGKRDRFKIAEKIAYRLFLGVWEDAEKQLQNLLVEYAEKCADSSEAYMLLRKISAYGWTGYYGEKPGGRQILAKLFEKAFGVEVASIDFPAKGGVILYTKDGYAVKVSTLGYDRMSLSMWPLSKILKAAPATLKMFCSGRVGAQHLEYTKLFIDESKRYFEQALTKVKELLSKDERFAALFKVSSISSGGGELYLLDALETELVFGDRRLKLPDKDAFIKKLKQEAEQKLRNLKIEFNKHRRSNVQEV